MSIKTMVSDAKQRMHASVETVRRELSALRTGRAAVSMLDGIRVDYYGTPTPLNQVGNLAIPDAALITIQPWDPTLLSLIEKAIAPRDRGLERLLASVSPPVPASQGGQGPGQALIELVKAECAQADRSQLQR